jgi:hypothetical protein
VKSPPACWRTAASSSVPLFLVLLGFSSPRPPARTWSSPLSVPPSSPTLRGRHRVVGDRGLAAGHPSAAVGAVWCGPSQSVCDPCSGAAGGLRRVVPRPACSANHLRRGHEMVPGYRGQQFARRRTTSLSTDAAGDTSRPMLVGRRCRGWRSAVAAADSDSVSRTR